MASVPVRLVPRALTTARGESERIVIGGPSADKRPFAAHGSCAVDGFDTSGRGGEFRGAAGFSRGWLMVERQATPRPSALPGPQAGGSLTIRPQPPQPRRRKPRAHPVVRSGSIRVDPSTLLF